MSTITIERSKLNTDVWNIYYQGGKVIMGTIFYSPTFKAMYFNLIADVRLDFSEMQYIYKTMKSAKEQKENESNN